MRILITGGAGFIGSHLYEKLKVDHEVICVDNFFHSCDSPARKVSKYADVRYYNDIEPYVKWCDVVCHLAAQIHVDRSITNPQETVDINITGTLNVLEAVRKYDKMMVFASSSEVYGTAQEESIKETHPLDSQSPYAASKAGADRLCKSYYETYGTKVAILRNFNTFGPYQADDSYGGVIAIFTRKALSGQPIRVFGSGLQERDYIYVDDAVRGYELCLSKGLWGKPVNIGLGETIAIGRLAVMIKQLVGSQSEIVNVEGRAGEVMRLCANIDVAKGYGFIPQTNFIRDLEKYIRWYQTNISL